MTNFDMIRKDFERENFLRVAETVVVRSNRGNGWALTTEDKTTDDIAEAVADMMVVIKRNRILIKACLNNKEAIGRWFILRCQGNHLTASNGIVLDNASEAIMEEQEWLTKEYVLLPWTAEERVDFIQRVYEWEKIKKTKFEKRKFF